MFYISHVDRSFFTQVLSEYGITYFPLTVLRTLYFILCTLYFVPPSNYPTLGGNNL